MSDHFSRTLNDQQYQMWQQYLMLEGQGLRPQALQVLKQFIQAFQRLAPEQRAPFIELLCTQIFDEGQAIPLRYPIVSEVLAPYLIEQYHQQSVVAPRWIARLTHWFNSTPRYREQLGLGYISRLFMLWEARKRDPGNLLVQRELVKVMAQQFNYSIHEIPAGVLYGVNGASIAECSKLLDEVEEFRQLARNTQLLDQYQQQLSEWEFYFKAYADYIGNSMHYTGFADYLRRYPRS